LRALIRRYAVQNAASYPYITDFYQETKPFMRALHNAENTNVLRQVAGLAWALAWKQGPRELVFGNYSEPTPFTVTGVEVIRNRDLYQQYLDQKRRIILDLSGANVPRLPAEDQTQFQVFEDWLPLLDAAAKECVLFSGFSAGTLQHIVSGGFRPDLGSYDAGFFGLFGGKGHGALGRGAYFTDRISKAVAYSPCSSCQMTGACKSDCNMRPPRKLLVSRVLLGNSLQVQDGSSFRHAHHNDMVSDSGRAIQAGRAIAVQPVAGPNYHSIIGLASKAQGKGGFSAPLTTAYFDSDEYLIRNPAQAYPEFIITYTVP
jgi:hypothetical protein